MYVWINYEIYAAMEIRDCIMKSMKISIAVVVEISCLNDLETNAPNIFNVSFLINFHIYSFVCNIGYIMKHEDTAYTIDKVLQLNSNLFYLNRVYRCESGALELVL